MNANGTRIETGTNIIGGCWVANRDIDAHVYIHHTVAFWNTRIPSKARGVVSSRASTHTTRRETPLSPCPLHIRIEIRESKYPPYHDRSHRARTETHFSLQRIGIAARDDIHQEPPMALVIHMRAKSMLSASQILPGGLVTCWCDYVTLNKILRRMAQSYRNMVVIYRV